MFRFFTAWTIASAIFYILVVLFVLWMIYRFVIAHESIAESVNILADERIKDGKGPKHQR